MWNSQIIRITNGAINTVNDAVIGNQQGITGVSKFAGQLGAPVFIDDSQLIYSAAIGTVYGGRFRYVQLGATSAQPVVGQIVFWDITAADNLYRVSTLESGSVPGAQLRAGIVLNSAWTPGNYSFIQDMGPTYVKYRAALTQAPAGIGTAVFAAAAGAGADNGLADVVNSADPSTFGDVGLLTNRYLGASIDLPSNGGLGRVYLSFQNLRG